MNSIGFWEQNPAAVEKLRVMWGEGLSAGEIGRRLGCGKNSVVSKKRRMGLEDRPTPIREKGSGAGIKRSWREARDRRRASAAVRLPTLAAVSTPAAPKQVAPKRAAPKQEQTIFASNQYPPERKCLFPIGEVKTKGFRFCCKRVVTPGPYCQACRRKAYAPRRIEQIAA